MRTAIFAAKRPACTRAGLRSFSLRNRIHRLYKSSIPLLQIRLHNEASAETLLAVTFDDERVQGLLKRMTGKDFDKIFAVRVEELEVPKYQLMSDDQLQEVFIMKFIRYLYHR